MSSERGIDNAGGYLARMFRATEEANRRAFIEALPAGRGGALLDVGTHDGTFTERIAQRLRPSRTAGIEVTSTYAERARARGVEVTVGDIEDGLPFPDQSFDVVTANQVIEHVRQTDRLLSEIRRVLAPDGTAVISTNNLASWHNIVSLLLGRQPPPAHVSSEVVIGNDLLPDHGTAHPTAAETHLRIFTARALVALAEHHGLRLSHVETVGCYPLPPRAARIMNRLAPSHGAFTVAAFGRRG